MNFFEKHPALKKRFETLYENRRNEILCQLLETDDEYTRLCSERANTSMDLRNVLDDEQAKLFEKYSNSLHVHEIYEIDAIYNQAVHDTLFTLQDSGFL